MFRTIDAHVAGAPLRLVVEGVPSLQGATVAAKLDDARARHDRWRRLLMREPRGHVDLSGAILTEPDGPEADAGVVFMDTSDFGALCGHGVIAVVTIALERGLLTLAPGRDVVTLDTAAGRIQARFDRRVGDRRVRRVAYLNPPARVVAAGLALEVGRRSVPADIAACGGAYAIVDAERAGVALDPRRAAELRRVGPEVACAARAALSRRASDTAAIDFAGTVFTGPAAAADLRSATVYVDGALDRSPGGTPTGAVLAVLHAMGLLREDRWFVHESLIGTTLRGRIVAPTSVDEQPAVLTEIEGSAYITGEHTFYLDEGDPLGEGYSF